jgi:hypothetical protein
MTRRQQVAALDDGTRTPAEIARMLGCKLGSVYQARWENKQPSVPLRKRPSPRADLAMSLLAKYTAGGMTDFEAVELTATDMGLTAATVRDYRSRLTGHRTNYSDASDAGKPRPRCCCGLTLFSPEELARGTCNNCLPTSAIELLGRTGEPVGAMSLPR